jgi:VWFA-related protein
MRTGIGVIGAAAAGLLCSIAAMRAQQPQPGQQPAFRTGVEVVSVEVGVVDKQGQPVRGLAPGDFIVTVGGQPRHVVTAEFIDAAPPPADGAGPPDGAGISTNEGAGIGRMVLFVVDQNTLEVGSARQVARSSERFFSGLTFADRSALALLPVGTGVGFTWAHATVRDALQRVTGMAGGRTTWEYGSLADARDIANANSMAIRNLSQRECASVSAGNGGGFGGNAGGSGDAGATADPPAASGPGDTGRGGTGGTSTPATGSGGQAGGGSRGGGGSSSPLGGSGSNSCTRDIQMQADSVWRMTQMNSLSSISSLRQMLANLANVRGDKTVILISGGWPLDERDETTLMSTVASEATAARATIYTIFVPSTSFSADRRGIVQASSRDQYLHLGPLETLAGMTGGGTFRAEVSADTAFDRLRRELSGYYRIGVEKDPSDAGGKNRRMKVQVARSSLTVRARDIFDLRTYEDRDWAARLSSALDSPVPASAVGVRVTSYVTSDPEDSRRVKIVLAGEASRMQPGAATFQLLVRDVEGKSILSGEKPLGEAAGDTVPFSAEVPVAPGTYIVRLAVMDGAGRVGSVDHRVEARQVALGGLTASRPLLIRVPTGPNAEARVAFEGLRQDDRLALQVDLDGEGAVLTGAGVVFEIAASADGPPLVQTPASMSHGSRDGSMVAQAVADLRVLPPGPYLVRAKVSSNGGVLGEVRRPFAVLEGMHAAAAEPVSVPDVHAARPAAPRLTARGTLPPFTLDRVLDGKVLAAFLDGIAARPDAASPAIRDLLVRSRSVPLGELEVPDALAAAAPAGAFLKGVSLLAQKKLEPAATAFRSAMNLSADFYPAMVYLGACYAAGGRDKEAAGVWRTALIKEGDMVAVHVLLADALLRQDRGDLAIQDLERARARWPDDDALNSRFAVAALLAGQSAEGLDALDELMAKGVKDEPSLALALLVLYEAFENGRPIQDAEQDRARMIRLSEGYRSQGGPSLALVDAWVAAATAKR